jgi:methyl-accepting chemotaxis protein
MLLRKKMLLGAALLAVVPVVITGGLVAWIANSIGKASVETQEKAQLTSLRDSRKQQIEDYFRQISRQSQSYANDKMIIDAMQEFRLAFSDLLEQSVPKRQAQATTLGEYRASLSDYYADDFSHEFDKRNPSASPDMSEYARKLGEDAVALQYNYIALNENPVDYKDEMEAAQDNSDYTRVHRKYHRFIRDFMSKFGYYDVYLVDTSSGEIVYSVSKKIDLGTSLIDGPFAKSGIGAAFRAANEASAMDAVVFEDFSPYLPLYNDQAGFVASPIYNGKKKIGVLVFQMPTDRINDIMTNEGSWDLAGLGDSGEIYLLAGDFTARNDRRLLLQNKDAYLADLKKGGTDAATLATIAKKQTSIGSHKVENTAAHAAIDGVYGVSVIKDYRGVEVLSAYAPLEVAGLKWGILAQIDTLEAYAPVRALTLGIVKGAVPTALIVLLLGLGLGWLFVGGVFRPIRKLGDTVDEISRGNFTARARLDTGDEMETLGNALDHLLDERLTQLARAEQENELLNNSVIELLKATALLSKRDLTVHVPVTEDITGPVADAINLMASETAKVLIEVRAIAEQVELASNKVKRQGDSVSSMAASERMEVERALAELTTAAEAMAGIAAVARTCDDIAARATSTTQTALQTVTSTVDGMNNIRETINETEKRIKRLGERSQEINGIVGIINNIAERTHVLALNASMQAAAAGDAGRGFAVVAEEVQRLAESSRSATSQISSLVNNIQVETADAMMTMNKTISQVVAESELAERAGQQMQETQQTTASLVNAVKRIAEDSQQQALVSVELKERGQKIHHSTGETNRELEGQRVETEQLVLFSQRLTESVRVFKLPTDGETRTDTVVKLRKHV